MEYLTQNLQFSPFYSIDYEAPFGDKNGSAIAINFF